jgi:hypothetical protein
MDFAPWLAVVLATMGLVLNVPGSAKMPPHGSEDTGMITWAMPFRQVLLGFISPRVFRHPLVTLVRQVKMALVRGVGALYSST